MIGRGPIISRLLFYIFYFNLFIMDHVHHYLTLFQLLYPYLRNFYTLILHKLKVEKNRHYLLSWWLLVGDCSGLHCTRACIHRILTFSPFKPYCHSTLHSYYKQHNVFYNPPTLLVYIFFKTGWTLFLVSFCHANYLQGYCSLL